MGAPYFSARFPKKTSTIVEETNELKVLILAKAFRKGVAMGFSGSCQWALLGAEPSQASFAEGFEGYSLPASELWPGVRD